ncbi:MAG: DUF1028 domain-containing protein, partial [Phycisphaerales bacterium]|nr:DUF1028 domain-containing protein [Phycisphaerales bacterium]
MDLHMRSNALRVSALGCLLTLCAAASATWSIIVVDTRTREIAVASATCVQSINLRTHLPVVRPEFAAACAQSFVDTTGANRLLIWNEFANGTDPDVILALLEAADPQHQTRQYGLVDWLGRSATFTGSGDGAYANGITGTHGTLVYSIQGNVITCQAVLDEAERAIRQTPGTLPAKVMAAMEAAAAMGGDGRCSCTSGGPTDCGCPPTTFTKSAHVGFLIDARRGDTLGTCTPSAGCATGTYYMTLNVANQRFSDPDPVVQLRQRFDTFRTNLQNAPDAIESRAEFSHRHLVAGSPIPADIEIIAMDWRGEPATLTFLSILEHDPRGSAGSTAIAPVEILGNGRFRFPLTAGDTTGIDRFMVRLLEATRTRIMMPSPEIRVLEAGDMNGDGHVNNFDIEYFALALGNP